MNDVMKYKEFIGSVRYSGEDETFYGKLEGIDDLIMFEGDSVKDLNLAFKEAVEDYKELCLQTGKQLGKSYKGSFNVRIDPDLHIKAAKKSVELGLSLNKFVEKAIADLLQDSGDNSYDTKS
jgi:predicted HicB family RNase H-like nuclease